MVHKCVIRGCRSEWYPDCDLKFHVFPKNISRRNVWLSLVPLKTQFYEGAKICSLHFKQGDYEFTGKRLKQSANPFFMENSKTQRLTQNQIPMDDGCCGDDDDIILPVMDSAVPVSDENTPLVKKDEALYKEISVQVELKTKREELLLKRNKDLLKKLKKKNNSIDNIKNLLAVIKNYEARSEIENIIKNNFSDICKHILSSDTCK